MSLGWRVQRRVKHSVLYTWNCTLISQSEWLIRIYIMVQWDILWTSQPSILYACTVCMLTDCHRHTGVLNKCNNYSAMHSDGPLDTHTFPFNSWVLMVTIPAPLHRTTKASTNRIPPSPLALLLPCWRSLNMMVHAFTKHKSSTFVSTDKCGAGVNRQWNYTNAIWSVGQSSRQVCKSN